MNNGLWSSKLSRCFWILQVIAVIGISASIIYLSFGLNFNTSRLTYSYQWNNASYNSTTLRWKTHSVRNSSLNNSLNNHSRSAWKSNNSTSGQKSSNRSTSGPTSHTEQTTCKWDRNLISTSWVNEKSAFWKLVNCNAIIIMTPLLLMVGYYTNTKSPLTVATSCKLPVIVTC